jgi:hypothetical protein
LASITWSALPKLARLGQVMLNCIAKAVDDQVGFQMAC